VTAGTKCMVSQHVWDVVVNCSIAQHWQLEKLYVTLTQIAVYLDVNCWHDVESEMECLFNWIATNQYPIASDKKNLANIHSNHQTQSEKTISNWRPKRHAHAPFSAYVRDTQIKHHKQWRLNAVDSVTLLKCLIQYNTIGDF